MTPAYLPAPPYECRRKPTIVSATVFVYKPKGKLEYLILYFYFKSL